MKNDLRRLVAILLGALPAISAVLATAACTSLTIEPRNPHEGVVVGHAWSFNILTITIPLDPRQRAFDRVANATLEDVRNAEVDEWPDFIWPISWLNGLIGFCGAEVRADYGLPAPVGGPGFPVSERSADGEGPPSDLERP